MNVAQPARILSLMLPLLLLPLQLFGQGTIRGSVVDSAGHSALIGANVYLLGTAMGSVTDREGEFRIPKVPSGSYTLKISYLGYTTRELPVTVTSDVTEPIHVALLQSMVEGEEVTVTAQARGQVSAINQQISSSTIINVISEEKIQELPDANAAEAIGRLPGVSITRSGGEANKVILRGLSDNFTTVTVDGIKIPPTDADSRGVDLSIVSQGSLAGVELFKALTPDKDADAIGGSINLVTRKAPTEMLLRLDARGDYNQLMDEYGQYDFALRYGDRFFNNVFGVQAQGNLERLYRSNERYNITYNQALHSGTDYEISDLLLEFNNEIRRRSGGSLLLDLDTPDSGSVRLNTIFSRTDRSWLQSRRDYPYGTGISVTYQSRDREQEINSFNTALQGRNYLGALTFTWGASFAQSKADYPYDYYIDFIEPSIIQGNVVVSGMRGDTPALKSSPEQLIPYALNNFQVAYLNTAYYRSEENLDKEKTAYLNVAGKYLLGSKLSGEVKVGGKYKYKNRNKVSGELYSPYYLGYWRAFTRETDGSFRKKDFTGTWFEPFYQRFQQDMSTRNPFATDFLDQPPDNRMLYDTYSLQPIVDRNALRLWYDLNKNGVDSLGRSYEYYTNPAAEADFYDVVERVGAGYIMNTLDFGQSVTFIAGLRVEQEKNDYRSKFSPSGLGGFPIPSGPIHDTTSTYTETIWLPNFHLTVRPTDFAIFRVAAYRALLRPDFNMRLEKFVSQGGGGNLSLLLGNSQLKTAKAWNYELNASFFGPSFGLISASVYYKEISDMFHMLDTASTVGNTMIDEIGITWRTPHTGAYSLTAPYTSPHPTKVWGFEFEHQVNLGFLPGFLKNFVLTYNGSIVRSETYVLSVDTFNVYVKQPTGFPPPFDSVTVPITNTKSVEKKQSLENQPEFYGNIALGYDIGGFSIRLSLFHQSKYNISFSASGINDRVSNSYTRLDLAVKQRITDNISFMLNLNNLTNAVENVSIVNRIQGWEILSSSERYGLTGNLGVRLTL